MRLVVRHGRGVVRRRSREGPDAEIRERAGRTRAAARRQRAQVRVRGLGDRPPRDGDRVVLGGRVLGRHPHHERVCAHVQCDRRARRAARHRREIARRPLAHAHRRLAGIRHRRRQFHMRLVGGHRRGVACRRSRECPDAEIRERAGRTRAAARRQRAQVRVRGLRRRPRDGDRVVLGGRVLGRHPHHERVRPHVERDCCTRRAARHRCEIARRPLAHAHRRLAGIRHRRRQLHVRLVVRHGRGVARRRSRECPDAEIRERTARTRAAARRQRAQVRVRGLRRYPRDGDRVVLGRRCVLGRHPHHERVRAHAECDRRARRAARHRCEIARGPLAHPHRGIRVVDRRGELHVGYGIGHVRRVGRGARGERADAQRRERARGARGLGRRQSGQGRVGGLRRRHGLRRAGRADAEGDRGADGPAGVVGGSDCESANRMCRRADAELKCLKFDVRCNIKRYK